MDITQDTQQSGQEPQQEVLRPDLRRDRVTGRCWLAFGRRPSAEVVAGLKARGWRWSGLRGEWNNSRRYPDFPPGVEPDDQGFCDYNAERADLLEERADKREAAGNQRLTTAHTAVAGIPPGQPILVGHHSERHHRAALDKHDRNMRAGFALTDEAARLRSAAEGSRARQEKQGDPLLARRKVEKLQKLLARTHLREDVRADLERQLADAEEIAAQEIPCDVLEPKPGDLARVHGWLVLILKVNKKTLECMILNRGPRGSVQPYDRRELVAIISSGHQLPKYRGSAMVAGGMQDCGCDHASKQSAAICIGKKHPGLKDYQRGTRMGDVSIPAEALALLEKAPSVA